MSYGDRRGSKIDQRTVTYYFNGQKVHKVPKQLFFEYKMSCRAHKSEKNVLY